MSTFESAILGLFIVLSASARDIGTLSFRLVAPAPIVKSGQHVMVQVITSNTSNHEITYHNTQPFCDYSFRVLTSSGASAPETAFKRQLQCSSGPLRITGRNIVVTLKPGESNDETINVSDLFDLSQAGNYSVQATRTYPGIGQFSSNMASVSVAP